MKYLKGINENIAKMGGSDVKLYYFSLEHNYNLEYTVMSTSPQAALDAVIEHLKNDVNNQFDYTRYWKDATLDNLPKDYTLKELDLNEVIVTERS